MATHRYRKSLVRWGYIKTFSINYCIDHISVDIYVWLWIPSPIKLLFCLHCVVKGKGLKKKHDFNIDRRNEVLGKHLNQYGMTRATVLTRLLP